MAYKRSYNDVLGLAASFLVALLIAGTTALLVLLVIGTVKTP